MMHVLIACLVIMGCIQLYFWIGQLSTLSSSIDITGSVATDCPRVSLVIAIKNEEENLKKHLRSWCDQDYPSLDIIIIDDHSTDNSSDVLEGFMCQKLRYLKASTNSRGKKAALSYGISHSDADWIVTTDADCRPQSDQWITKLMASRKNADMIVGYSPHRRGENWVEQLVSYEAWYVAMQYISAVLLGRPYMSVGRNLAFTKSIYEEVKGYTSHDHILSGDDDLFLQEVKQKGKVTYGLSRDSWTWTHAPSSWSQYIRQKRRHISTATHYSVSDRWILIGVYVSQLAFYLLVFTLAFWDFRFLGVLLLRFMWISWVAYRSRSVIFLPMHWMLAPVYDMVLCLVNLMVSPYLAVSQKHW